MVMELWDLYDKDGKRTGEVYRPYIEGEKELHEINAEHR